MEVGTDLVTRRCRRMVLNSREIGHGRDEPGESRSEVHSAFIVEGPLVQVVVILGSPARGYCAAVARSPSPVRLVSTPTPGPTRSRRVSLAAQPQTDEDTRRADHLLESALANRFAPTLSFAAPDWEVGCVPLGVWQLDGERPCVEKYLLHVVTCLVRNMKQLEI